MTAEAVFRIKDSGAGKFIVTIAGELYTSNAASFVVSLNEELRKIRAKSVNFDLAELTGIDDFGVAVLAGIKKKVNEQRGVFILSNIQPAVHETLTVYNFDKLTAPPPALRPSSGIFT